MVVRLGEAGELPTHYHSLHCLKSKVEGECFYFAFLDISQGADNASHTNFILDQASRWLMVINYYMRLAEYTIGKWMERCWKVGFLRKPRYAVSTSPPGYYAHRFVERMNKYILPELQSDLEFEPARPGELQRVSSADHDGSKLMQEISSYDWQRDDYYDRCC